MIRKLLVPLALAALFGAVAIVGVNHAPAGDAKDVRRLAIHVDDKDPAKMNLALNNAQNVLSYYRSKGMKAEVRIVAYGPGLDMLRKDISPVKDRISQMSLAEPTLSFAACGNTKAAVEKQTKKEVAIVDEATVVPAGVVELMELQRAGWSYIRP